MLAINPIHLSMLWHKYIFILALLSYAPYSHAGKNLPVHENIDVALRMIGHEFLRASGDSTSRIFPIQQVESNQYLIHFDTEFSFVPDVLTPIADRIVSKTQIAKEYLVQIKNCDSGKVVHSFRVLENDSNFLPCMGRLQPVDCYVILFHIITPGTAILPPHNLPSKGQNQASYNSRWWYVALAGLCILLVVLFRKIIKSGKSVAGVISLGEFAYDPTNMTLEKGNNRQELTGKENDLLHLLYLHLNQTIDKEIILKEVWRDEGVYIGRTLDVYISKLRKKFESDPAIKIINVRGVGYKMTLN